MFNLEEIMDDFCGIIAPKYDNKWKVIVCCATLMMMMMKMVRMKTTYSLVCQVEDLAIEEGCLPLLDGDHCLRVPKIWTRNKFVWGKWHVLDHHNLPSDWTEALNTLKCQTHRQNIFLECRNWFHFGRCQWAGWRQKYKSVYQQNFHWEFSDILSEISESGKYRGNICEHPPHIIWSMKV